MKGLLPKEPHNLLELGALADEYMWNWTESKLKENMQIGNVFIFDNYPKVPAAKMIDALYHD